MVREGGANASFSDLRLGGEDEGNACLFLDPLDDFVQTVEDSCTGELGLDHHLDGLAEPVEAEERLNEIKIEIHLFTEPINVVTKASQMC